MKRTILASASFLTLAISAHATAQTGQADIQPPARIDGLEEIVVTAQRIAESAQRTPIAIDVIKPEELTRQGVTRAEDLSRTSPALSAANGGGANTVFFVRGVGNFTVNAYSDSAVAFNYDGVYIGRPTSTSGTFYDLERVEVLKGPQGTLYGRNATGGAINVIPRRPEPGVLGAEFMASYGSYDQIIAQGALNLPIGDRGAARFSGSYAKRDGYNSDGTGDQDEYAFRGQLYADLTDTLNVRVAADTSHQGGAGGGAFYIGQYNPTFGPSGITGYSFTPSGFSPSDGLHDVRSENYLASRFVGQAGRAGERLDSYPYNDSTFWGVTTEINWETDAGTLTVQPAYREASLDFSFTNAGMRSGRTREDDQQFSVEARWAGKIGPSIDYLLGGMYFDEDIKGRNVQFSQFVLTPFQTFTTNTDSYALFGKLGVAPVEGLTLTAAGRYTWDKKRFNGLSDTYILFCGNPAPPPQDFCPTLPFMPLVDNAAQLRAFYAARGIPTSNIPLYVLPGFVPGTPFVLNAPIPINDRINNSKFTYRLAAQYDFTPHNMVYASFETGYHSGGFSFARGLSSYSPETIEAYTIGTKNRFWGNRLQVNVEGFLWKYHDQQYSQFGFDLGTPPATVFLTRNIGESTIKGVDVDVEFLATPTTLLAASVQYLPTKYDSFVFFTPNQGTPPNTGCPFTPTTQVINGTTVSVFAVDCSGKPAFNSPKWSFNLQGQQTIPLGDNKIVLQAGTRYRSEAVALPDYLPYGNARGSFVSSASVTFSTGSGWYVTGFVNNIEGNRRLSFATNNNSAAVVVGNAEEPRTYGIRVGGSF
ncbi:TonB-dependent receptor [Novosphingobium sp. BL-52-GroH]|uniref:TonB-dependent receptor n=1 Tax=Novosphingobium sp. BL-52-GroH TaxID=3349877 RepID=UPI00384BEC8C